MQFQHREQVVEKWDRLKKIHEFLDVLKHRTTIEQRSGQWSFVIDFRDAVKDDRGTEDHIINLMTGGGIEWTNPAVEEVEKTLKAMGICLFSSDPLSPRDNERETDLGRWKAKRDTDAKLEETSFCHLRGNFVELIGEQHYRWLEDVLVERRIVPFAQKTRDAVHNRIGLSLVAVKQNKRLSHQHGLQNTVLSLKGEDLTRTVHTLARGISPGYEAMRSRRHFGMKLTVHRGTVAELSENNRMPASVMWSSNNKFETVVKDRMSLAGLREFVRAFMFSVKRLESGWLAVTRPNRKALALLISGVQQQEGGGWLIYWRNQKVFEATDHYNGGQILEIANSLIDGTKPLQVALHLKVMDRVDID